MTLIEKLTTAVKSHSRAIGIISAIIGCILVIYYCASIRFYPTGLTIADTLFFIWTVVVFGLFYSTVAFAYFMAACFWVTILSKPINLFIRRFSQGRIFVLIPKSELLFIVVFGLLCNLVIFLFVLAKGHSILHTGGTLVSIGIAYSILESISKYGVVTNDLVDTTGKHLLQGSISPKAFKYILYLSIYGTPLLLGQVGGGITKATFETMGVRQPSVSLALDASGYEQLLTQHLADNNYPISQCTSTCLLSDVNILFTNVGSNTKIEIPGGDNYLYMTFPSSQIKFITKQNH